MVNPAIHLQYGTLLPVGRSQEWLDNIPDARAASVDGTSIYVTIGHADTIALTSEQMLRDIEEQVALVARPAAVFVTTFQGGAWTQVLPNRIAMYLPHDALLSVRVLHSSSFYEHIETWECSELPPVIPTSPFLSSPSSSSHFPNRDLRSTSVTISINGLTKPILSRVLELPRLNALTVHGLLEPIPSISIGNYYRDELLWFLCFPRVSQDLQRVVISLDLCFGIQPVLEKLQELRVIDSLELTMYTRFGALQSHRNLEIALEKGLENLHRLEELIVPVQLVTPSASTLVDLLNRMFNSSSQTVDERGIRYYNPARDLLYGTPAMFLPGRIF